MNYTHEIVSSMAYKLGFQKTPLPAEWTEFLAMCDSCPLLAFDGCSDCQSCSWRWNGWHKRIVNNHCPKQSKGKSMPTATPPTFPTVAGLYWAQIPTAGPPPATPVYNAILIITGTAPYMKLAVRPTEPRSMLASRVWGVGDVLAVGPAITPPTPTATTEAPTAAGLYWAVVQPPNQPVPALTAYNALLNQYGVTPFLSIHVDFLNPDLNVPGKLWQPSDLLLIGDALTPPAMS